LDVVLDWHGYELHPDTPPGGLELSRRFGADRIGPMHERLRRFALGFGIADLRLRDRSPNTRRALALAEFARDQGALDRFRVLAMEAHWRRGLDLESDLDLGAIAAEAGLDRQAAVAASRDQAYLARIDAKREEALARGVTAIPTFVIGDRALVGCEPYEAVCEFALQGGARRRS